ncbi:MotA/TolQ/ExbB proton channel family protein [candidate division WOR-3 bacterium]|nr:MotA/TolQ/ExbB proton channel family protein [candidate division WOR-3 bacterium]
MAGISFLTLLKTSWAIDLLLVFSIVALAVILERLWAYRQLRIDEGRLLKRVQGALKKGNIEEAIYLCEAAKNPLAEIFIVGIRNRRLPREDISDLLDGAIIEAKTFLEKRNVALSTISFIAPLLGLLGTVLGIIRAFHDLAVSGAGGPSVVMAGVAEALVSTAIGIIVAIPAAIFYNFFMNNVKGILTKIESTTRKFLTFLNLTFEKERIINKVL